MSFLILHNWLSTALKYEPTNRIKRWKYLWSAIDFLLLYRLENASNEIYFHRISFIRLTSSFFLFLPHGAKKRPTNKQKHHIASVENESVSTVYTCLARIQCNSCRAGISICNERGKKPPTQDGKRIKKAFHSATSSTLNWMEVMNQNNIA